MEKILDGNISFEKLKNSIMNTKVLMWIKWLSKQYILSVIIYVVLNIGDTLTTYLLLDGEKGVEMNPIAMMFGFPTFFVFKLIFTGLIIIGLIDYYFSNNNNKKKIIDMSNVISIANVFFLVVVLNNLIILIK